MVAPRRRPLRSIFGRGRIPMSEHPTPREIPFNYTSADDRQAIALLLGPAVWQQLEELRARRVTGRSARLLMRFFGEILIHRRNPFLFQELVDSNARRRRFFENIEKDLGLVQRNANAEPRVLEVLGECGKLLEAFRAEVDGAPELRRRMTRELGAVVGKDNVLFDPFAIVSHATDATDWRLHLPLAVVMPDDEAQVAPLLAAIAQLGLKAIPRGAGTGLTGGAVPLRPGCVVVNTEKLNRIRGISDRTFVLAGGTEAKARVLELEAGVVTEKAMEHASEHGFVFATDPTSAWACTIGGNIAENAGGKDCVLYGTCIDNLVSWRMAMPSGRRWTIRRADHQLRKILPEDAVTFEVVGRGRDGGAAHPAPRRRDPQEGALEGHHQQGAGRRPRPAEGGDRRRHHLGGVHPLPGVRGEADALPRVLRAGLRRGLPGDPRAVARVPLPGRRERGAVGARALRRRVRPRHRLQGEGAAGRDAQGGAPHRRRRARPARRPRAASRRSARILRARTRTRSCSRRGTRPRGSASGPTARSSARSRGARTPSR